MFYGWKMCIHMKKNFSVTQKNIVKVLEGLFIEKLKVEVEKCMKTPF